MSSVALMTRSDNEDYRRLEEIMGEMSELLLMQTVIKWRTFLEY